MIKGKTESGFEFELHDDVMDNMELVELMVDINTSGNPVAMGNAMTAMLGAKQKKALYDHLRTEDGRVPVSKVSMAFVDVIKAAKEKGKN